MFLNREELNEHKTQFKHHAMIRRYPSSTRRQMKGKEKHKKAKIIKKTKYKFIKKKMKSVRDRNLKKICKFCQKQFADSCALRKHEKYIHFEGVQSRPFVCKKCNKCFARKYSLETHWKMHAKNQNNKQNQARKRKCVLQR